ncbi:MAG: hemerythrin domain-containing protein [Burkholderiales bacterium]|nr:hemerythrin domain-containing protein [Burkholderiales bacterium]MDE2276770.1 hemerythrin domain-containing protein [Burkholderiales bacterium]
MRHLCLEVVTGEHRALSAMLQSIGLLVMQARRERRRPDFEVLRAMLLYIDEFPERLHHPKEQALLFPKVAARCPELAPALERLARDHANGELAIRRLEHALLAYEVLGEPRRVDFERQLEAYTRFYFEHMALEENEILPAAQRSLSAADWEVLDTAFAANLDPLTGHEATLDYQPLFSKILMMAPAPVGLAAAPAAPGTAG